MLHKCLHRVGCFRVLKALNISLTFRTRENINTIFSRVQNISKVLNDFSARDKNVYGTVELQWLEL